MIATAGLIAVLLVGVWILVGKLSDGSQDPVSEPQNRSVPQAVPSAGVSPAPSVTAPSDEVSAAWAAKVKLGVSRGTSRSAVAGFESWLGRDVNYVVDFSSRGSWDEIANPDYMIDEWAGSKHRVVYSTGLLPDTGRSSIALGAKGNYDRYYRTLAQNLVNAGEDDAIIRLGWEFNLGTSNWSTDNPKEFIAYWRHIIKAMRSVDGQHFQFDWNPNAGDTTYDATLYYPGDAYVDYIGIDIYDVSWEANSYPFPESCTSVACRLPRQEAAWEHLYNDDHGLGFWSDFAAAKKKPMSLPEWGAWTRTDGHGGGDDPYFIEEMYRFIANPRNNVAYQAYFETNTTDGQHRLMTSFPNAGKVFLRRFGDKK